MRVNSIVVATALGAAALLAGCSPSIPTNGVSYEHYRFTCCANTDLQQAWHPGQKVTLHWIAESSGMTFDATQHPITLSAVLTGPYASVALLKTGGPHAQSVAATPIPVTDRTSGNQVSSIDLPLDLPTGWYNLAFTIESAGGNGVRSASVIQVTRINS